MVHRLGGLTAAQFVAYRELQSASGRRITELTTQREQLNSDRVALTAASGEKDHRIKELTDRIDAISRTLRDAASAGQRLDLKKRFVSLANDLRTWSRESYLTWLAKTRTPDFQNLNDHDRDVENQKYNASYRADFKMKFTNRTLRTLQEGENGLVWTLTSRRTICGIMSRI